MKKFLLSLLQICFLFQFALAGTTVANKKDRSEFEICTYNIRGDKAIDGDNQWKFRRDSVYKMLNESSYDVICLQEAKQFQLEEILENVRFSFVGNRGMYNPILFDADRLELLHTDTYWLSESGAPCSVGWDGKYDRYCTWAQFKERKTGKIFFVFNAHLDHKGEVAQREGAKLAAQKAIHFGGDSPIVLCGDMNVKDDTEAYKSFISYLKDSRSLAPKVKGPKGTFHSFGRIEPFRIDYLFVNNKVKVLNYVVNDRKFKNGTFPSDHYPVSIKISVK